MSEFDRIRVLLKQAMDCRGSIKLSLPEVVELHDQFHRNETIVSRLLKIINDHGDPAMKAHVADLMEARIYVDKIYVNLLTRAEEAEGELDEFIMIHPRAVKLLRKKKNFLVVAEDEPYFFKVYVLLRAHEKEIGRWTDEDENNYQKARQAYYGRHIDLPEVKE